MASRGCRRPRAGRLHPATGSYPRKGLLLGPSQLPVTASLRGQSDRTACGPLTAVHRLHPPVGLFNVGLRERLNKSTARANGCVARCWLRPPLRGLTCATRMLAFAETLFWLRPLGFASLNVRYAHVSLRRSLRFRFPRLTTCYVSQLALRAPCPSPARDDFFRYCLSLKLTSPEKDRRGAAT